MIMPYRQTTILDLLKGNILDMITPTPASSPNIIDILRALSSYYEDRWGVRPILTIACVGYSDEHWQLRHPADEMPHLCVLRSGQVEYHPDSPRQDSVTINDKIPRI